MVSKTRNFVKIDTSIIFASPFYFPISPRNKSLVIIRPLAKVLLAPPSASAYTRGGFAFRKGENYVTRGALPLATA